MKGGSRTRKQFRRRNHPLGMLRRGGEIVMQKDKQGGLVAHARGQGQPWVSGGFFKEVGGV